MAVLDAADTGSECTCDAFGGIDMDHDIGTPVFRRFDGRANLLLEKFGHVQRVVEGGCAAARQQLDLRRALPQVFTGCRRHCIRSVHDPRCADRFDPCSFAAASRMAVFVDHAEVAVS